MATYLETATTADYLLERVKEIAPTIREHAAEAERERRLSRPVVDAMREAELFKMSRPKAYGGFELDPVGIFRVIEEVARHDSAAGWNLNLSAAIDHMPAWLPDEGADEIYSTPDLVLAGVFFPGGHAVPVEGGYRVGGRWKFLSGCQHASWVLTASVLTIGDEPQLDDDGNPRELWTWLRADEINVLDTWHTLGMRGTGSHDIRAEDVFVPVRRTAPKTPIQKPGSAFTGPLYRLTVWPPIAYLAPPALGIARAAIERFRELARDKTPSYTVLAVRDRQVVQRQIAEAEASLGSGRAYLHQTFAEAWTAAVNGEPIDLDRKIAMQLATTRAVACAADAVDLIHSAAGASAVRDELDFQRHFRDVHTITQHAFSSAQRYESAGALMLETESDWGFFAF